MTANECKISGDCGILQPPGSNPGWGALHLEIPFMEANPPGQQLLDEAPRVRALRQLRQMITEGILPHGQNIPPERDMAARLGVSLSSLQRALKVLEQEGMLIRGSGRDRMINHPLHEVAGMLANTVLIMGDEGYTEALINPIRGWAAFIAVGALHSLSAGGQHTMAVNPAELTVQRMEHLLSGKPSGVLIPEIFIPKWDSTAWANLCIKANVPVVLYGDEAGYQDFDRVVADHEAGVYELTRFLLTRGRRNILQHISSHRSFRWLTARRRGYERAMREAGLEPLPALDVHMDLGAVPWEILLQVQRQSALGALVEVGPEHDIDAIMAVSDGCVTPFCHAIKAWGRVPNVDIDVVGYDDYWKGSVLPYDLPPETPLATIDKNNMESGQQLVALLRDRIAGNLPPEPQCRLIAPTLKIYGE